MSLAEIKGCSATCKSGKPCRGIKLDGESTCYYHTTQKTAQITKPCTQIDFLTRQKCHRVLFYNWNTCLEHRSEGELIDKIKEMFSVPMDDEQQRILLRTIHDLREHVQIQNVSDVPFL